MNVTNYADSPARKLADAINALMQHIERCRDNALSRAEADPHRLQSINLTAGELRALESLDAEVGGLMAATNLTLPPGPKEGSEALGFTGVPVFRGAYLPEIGRATFTLAHVTPAGAARWEARMTAFLAAAGAADGVGQPVTARRSSAPQPLRPRWNEDTRTLYLGDRPIKKYNRGAAKNQIDVIEAFERAGWPDAVDDPFGDSRTLNQTLRGLKTSLPPRTLRFVGDGTGERVIWEYAT